MKIGEKKIMKRKFSSIELKFIIIFRYYLIFKILQVDVTVQTHFLRCMKYIVIGCFAVTSSVNRENAILEFYKKRTFLINDVIKIYLFVL